MLGEISGYLVQARAGESLAWVQVVLLVAVTLCFVGAAAVLWRIDVRQHRLPDKIVLPLYALLGLPLLVVLWIDGDIARMRQVAYSAVFLGGSYLLLHYLSRKSLGLGDVKLAGVIGLACGFFSPLNILWATLLAFVLGGCVALLLVITRRASAQTHIAFGPFMLVGALVAFFFPVY